MWVPAGADRWSWEADDDQHLLVRDGNRLVELHGTTMHAYVLPAGVTLDPVAPLKGAVFAGTTQGAVPLVRQQLADADAFALLDRTCRATKPNAPASAPKVGGR